MNRPGVAPAVTQNPGDQRGGLFGIIQARSIASDLLVDAKL